MPHCCVRSMLPLTAHYRPWRTMTELLWSPPQRDIISRVSLIVLIEWQVTIIAPQESTMCNAYNHSSYCRCGWGGDGHLGAGGWHGGYSTAFSDRVATTSRSG